MFVDVIVVGGGLAGLSFARALRDSPLTIALVEHQPPARPPGWDARVYAISPANAAFLNRIGAWAQLDAGRIAPIYAMQVRGDGGARLDFSAYDTGVPELGWIIESSHMACKLWQDVAQQENVTLHCPASPGALSLGKDLATLTLCDGQTLSAKLVVGADGRDSWVRTQAGLKAHDTPYGDMGVVANFECERPHRGIARQWFRDDGVLAWLPLAGGDGQGRVSIVWSTAQAHADTLLALDPEALAKRVAEAGQNELGALTQITPTAAFPLRLIRVPQTVSRRLALIGDAAHGIHPLSGHGINLGYRDAEALAGVLSHTERGRDIGDETLLRRYQRGRREETLLMQYTTHTLRQLFHEKLPGFRLLRNTGMNLTNALPAVKNLLVRYALGTL